MRGLSTRVAVTRAMMFVALWLVATGVSASEAVQRKVELVMLEQQGCPWCSRWNQEIGGIYAGTEEGRVAPLRRIDIHAPLPEDLRTITKGVFTPSFILMADGREIGRIRGYPGADFFFPMLQELLDKMKSSKLDALKR